MFGSSSIVFARDIKLIKEVHGAFDRVLSHIVLQAIPNLEEIVAEEEKAEGANHEEIKDKKKRLEVDAELVSRFRGNFGDGLRNEDLQHEGKTLIKFEIITSEEGAKKCIWPISFIGRYEDSDNFKEIEELFTNNPQQLIEDWERCKVYEVAEIITRYAAFILADGKNKEIEPDFEKAIKLLTKYSTEYELSKAGQLPVAGV